MDAHGQEPLCYRGRHFDGSLGGGLQGCSGDAAATGFEAKHGVFGFTGIFVPISGADADRARVRPFGWRAGGGVYCMPIVVGRV